MEPNYIDIGKRLALARRDAGFTQQALADAIKVSISYVKNVERGSKPSIAYLFAAKTICKVSFEWLLIGVNNDVCDARKDIAIPIYRPELQYIIDVLTDFMNTADSETAIWAKIQFKKAFSDVCAEFDRKNFINQHTSIPSLVGDKRKDGN